METISNDTNLHIFINGNLLKNGTTITCEWHNTLLPECECSDNDGFEVVSLAIDITQRLHDEQLLKTKANHDSLTTLPNRYFFDNILEKTYSLAKRNGGIFGLAFIDLDGFKAINDTYGHHAGDVLLIEISKGFQKIIRQEDTVARLGGDEFALLFHMSQTDEEYTNIINRLLKLANTPVSYKDNIQLQVSASVGISFYVPQNSVSVKELITQADKAMYLAKGKGKNCFCVYDV